MPGCLFAQNGYNGFQPIKQVPGVQAGPKREDMTQAELIYNAHAGRVVAWRELRSAIEYLEGAGWTVVVHETHAPR